MAAMIDRIRHRGDRIRTAALACDAPLWADELTDEDWPQGMLDGDPGPTEPGDEIEGAA